MNNVKKEVETSVIKYLSWESAILDFMEERGFNVKTYKEQIKQMTTQVYSPIKGLGFLLLPPPLLYLLICSYCSLSQSKSS